MIYNVASFLVFTGACLLVFALVAFIADVTDKES